MAEEQRTHEHVPPQWEWAKRIQFFVQAGEEPMASYQSSWLSDRSEVVGCAVNTHTILRNIKIQSAGRNGVGWMDISIEAPHKEFHYMARPFRGVPMFLCQGNSRRGPVDVDVLTNLLEDEECFNNHEKRLLAEVDKNCNLFLSAFLAFNVAEQWENGLQVHDRPGFIRRNGLSMKEIEIFLFVLIHLNHSILYRTALHGIFKYIARESREEAIRFLEGWIESHEVEVEDLRTYFLANVKASFVALAQPYVAVKVEDHISTQLNRNE